MQAALLLLLLQGGIDGWIAQWESDEPEKRDTATAEVLVRWKEWSEEELVRLDKAAESKDHEVAWRANEARRRIAIRRKFPKIYAFHSALDDQIMSGQWEALFLKCMRFDDPAELSSLVEFARLSDWTRQVKRSFGYRFLGRSVPAYVPLYIDLLAEKDFVEDAFRLLEFAPDETSKHRERIVALLDHASPRTRWAAVRVLKSMNDPVPDLLKAARNEVSIVRYHALDGLIRHEWGTHRNAVIRFLSSGLDDDADHIRLAMFRIIQVKKLKAFGTRLLGQLDHESRDVRIGALVTLGALGEGRALDRVTDLLHDEDELTRATATFVTGQLGAKFPPSIFKDRSPLVRRRALESMLERRPESLRQVVDMLDDRDLSVRVAALSVLTRHGGDVRKALKDANPRMRARALVAAWLLGVGVDIEKDVNDEVALLAEVLRFDWKAPSDLFSRVRAAPSKIISNHLMMSIIVTGLNEKHEPEAGRKLQTLLEEGPVAVEKEFKIVRPINVQPSFQMRRGVDHRGSAYPRYYVPDANPEATWFRIVSELDAATVEPWVPFKSGNHIWMIQGDTLFIANPSAVLAEWEKRLE